MSLANAIRNRRKALRMTLQNLASQVAADAGNLSRIERGELGINESNQQQQGARLKRTYSAMNNVAAGGKTTIHMPVKVRPLPQSLISPHPIINSLIDAP